MKLHKKIRKIINDSVSSEDTTVTMNNVFDNEVVNCPQKVFIAIDKYYTRITKKERKIKKDGIK